MGGGRAPPRRVGILPTMSRRRLVGRIAHPTLAAALDSARGEGMAALVMNHAVGWAFCPPWRGFGLAGRAAHPTLTAHPTLASHPTLAAHPTLADWWAGLLTLRFLLKLWTQHPSSNNYYYHNRLGGSAYENEVPWLDPGSFPT